MIRALLDWLCGREPTHQLRYGPCASCGKDCLIQDGLVYTHDDGGTPCPGSWRAPGSRGGA